MVLDMFAGIGPFSLLAAKKGGRVVAIDKNPVAIWYLRENARLNKIKESDEIEILEGDANDLALRYEGESDHVIMNLPHSASEFLSSALKAAKSGGIVHYYCIAPENGLFQDEAIIRGAAKHLNIAAEVVYKGVIRSYAPRRFNVVIDCRINKTV